MQAPRIERAKTLPGAAGQLHRNGIFTHAGIAVHPRNLAGQARADAAVGVANVTAELAALPLANHLGERGIQLRGQPIRRRLQRRGATITACVLAIACQQTRQIHIHIVTRAAQGLLQQIGAAHRFVQAAQAQ